MEDFTAAIHAIGMPCVIKPIMSSSGKGQSVVKTEADIEASWNYAQAGGRAGKGKVIVEGFVDFDYEITLLTVRHVDGTSFCAPIGHIQVDGDYRESWQPQAMSDAALKNAQQMAEAVTGSLGGYGLFGVELFVKDDTVIFSEVSPRPHDTGDGHHDLAGLNPICTACPRHLWDYQSPVFANSAPSASSVILVEGKSEQVSFGNLQQALSEPDTQLRLFGKPAVNGKRRMGVGLARAETIDAARAKACRTSSAVDVQL